MKLSGQVQFIEGWGAKTTPGIWRNGRYSLCNIWILLKRGFEAASRRGVFKTSPWGGGGEKSRQGRLSLIAISVTILKSCRFEHFNLFLKTPNFRFQMEKPSTNSPWKSWNYPLLQYHTASCFHPIIPTWKSFPCAPRLKCFCSIRNPGSVPVFCCPASDFLIFSGIHSFSSSTSAKRQIHPAPPRASCWNTQIKGGWSNIASFLSFIFLILPKYFTLKSISGWDVFAATEILGLCQFSAVLPLIFWVFLGGNLRLWWYL